MKMTLIRQLALACLLATAPQAYAQNQSKNVTIVLPETPPTVEPCEVAISTVGRVVKQNVAETLTELDTATGQVKPRLATSWELNGNTWRFKLREGVKFHDGSNFEAQAVVHTLERAMDKSLQCMSRNKYFANISLTAKAVDAHTVEITTETLEPILPTLLTVMPIVAADTAAGIPSRAPIGTGPYVLKEWDPAQRIVLERFADYWGEKPTVEQATYLWRAESAVQAAMVETGEADIAPEISAQDATNPQIDHSYLNSETSRVRIGSGSPILSDVRVRKALNLAVDRNAFIGTILSKDVQPATQLVVSAVAGYNADLKQWPYDPEAAKKLLAEAKADGVPVDSQIRLIGRANIFPNAAETMQALVQMWQAIGLNVEMQTLEVAQLNQAVTKPYAADRPPTVSIDQHDNNTGDASFTLAYKYSSTGAQSDTNDTTLDELIAKGLVSTGDERRKLFQESFARIAEVDVSDVMLFHMVGYARVNPRVVFEPDVSTNGELQIAKIKFAQ